MLARLFAVIAVAAFVSSCSWNISRDGLYQYSVPYQMAHRISDDSYEKIKLFWWGEFAGRYSTMYVKRFEVDGRLVICGMRVRATGFAESLEDAWFHGANFVIDGADITKMGFLLAQSEKHAVSGEVVACMNTGWPAHYSLMTKKIRVDGMPVRESIKSGNT